MIMRALLVAVVFAAGQTGAEELEPAAILKKVAEAYDALDTYSSEGTAQIEMDVGTKMKTETTFSIKLKKPNLYLITWKTSTTGMPVMDQAGAVWSDGTQPYLYMGIMNAYSKIKGDMTALGGATGISSGAAATIPFIFLSIDKDQPKPFSQLVEPKREKDEAVDGDDCYVISASSPTSKSETLWIQKDSHLIKKYVRSLEPPSGKLEMPEMTDEQLDEALKGMGQEATKENKESFRAMMRNTQQMMKTMNLKGQSVELHTKIESPKLTAEDFSFTPPAGTVLKDSLFGAAFGQQ